MIAKVKATIMAEEYLRNGLNATRAVKKFKPNMAKGSAEVEASRLLHNDKFKQSLIEIMEEQGITDAMLLKEHTKVIRQDKHLPSKNGALDMAYKLKGSYAPEKKAVFNIPANKIDETIQELLEEYKRLS